MKTKRLRWLLAIVAAAALPIAVLGPERHAHGLQCAGSVEEARRHMDRGLALFDKKRFLEAGAEFDAAYRAQPFSAFLCNAAMAYYEANDVQNAILRFQAFLAVEPNPPDRARIQSMLAWLEGRRAAQLAANDGGPGDAGAGDGAAEGGVAADTVGVDAGAPRAPIELARSFRSQVIVQSEPPEAPLRIYARRPGAPPFHRGRENPGWEKVVSGVKTPHDVSLGVGDYHIVIEAFKDYKRSETDISLSAGHLYEFKANLSQGEFLGFLRVRSPVEGARIYLDDPPPHRKGVWGRSPHGALVEPGEHTVWIEAPGYEPFSEKVTIEHGETRELSSALRRVGHGFLVIDANAEEVSVKVDGVRYGVYTAIGEPLRIRLPAGRHRVELDANGRKAFAGDVEVPGGRELAVHGRLSFKPSRTTAVLGGALAASAIVGGWVLIQQPTRTFGGIDANNRPIVVTPGNQPWMKIGGFVSLGVGALLGAATVYTLVADQTPASRVQLDKPRELAEDEKPAPPAPRQGPRLFGVAPAIGGDGAGVVVLGGF